MPAHVRYADRSISRLAKRDRVAESGKAPKVKPQVEEIQDEEKPGNPEH